MKITVIGTGYVGLVTGTLFASVGHDVTCVDNNETKIHNLNKGIIPIYEDSLETTIHQCVEILNTLHFSTDLSSHTNDADLIFLAVGTPQSENGSTDLSYIESCFRELTKYAEHDLYITIKSTVPAGTAQKMLDVSKEALHDERKDNIRFYISSNPEFLKEGTALFDALNPDRIVIGTDDEESKRRLDSLYDFCINPNLTKRPVPVVHTNVATAQLIKYASNAFNATKISFINALADYCNIVGANIDDVADGMGYDKRIGRAFLNAGIGFGGSCFPKDINSLKYEMSSARCDNELLSATLNINSYAATWPIRMLTAIYGAEYNTLEDKLNVTILGLSFKAGTDDVRCSIPIEIAKELAKSCNVTVYDPIAMNNAKHILKDSVKYASSMMSACENADVVIFATDWDEFKHMSDLSLSKIANFMRGKTVLDCRNMLDQNKMSALFDYYCVGKPHIN